MWLEKIGERGRWMNDSETIVYGKESEEQAPMGRYLELLETSLHLGALGVQVGEWKQNTHDSRSFQRLTATCKPPFFSFHSRLLERTTTFPRHSLAVLILSCSTYDCPSIQRQEILKRCIHLNLISLKTFMRVIMIETPSHRGENPLSDQKCHFSKKKKKKGVKSREEI